MQFETFRPYGHATHRDPRQPNASTFDFDAIAERVAQGLPPVPGLTKSEDGHWVRNVASSKPAPKSLKVTNGSKRSAGEIERSNLLRSVRLAESEEDCRAQTKQLEAVQAAEHRNRELLKRELDASYTESQAWKARNGKR